MKREQLNSLFDDVTPFNFVEFFCKKMVCPWEDVAKKAVAKTKCLRSCSKDMVCKVPPNTRGTAKKKLQPSDLTHSLLSWVTRLCEEELRKKYFVLHCSVFLLSFFFSLGRRKQRPWVAPQHHHILWVYREVHTDFISLFKAVSHPMLSMSKGEKL